jgi:hypothetical protein
MSFTMAESDPKRSVRFPPGYGETGSGDQLLPWSFVEERLQAAPNYWVVTVTPAGRPHARPLDGTWVEGALCFGGSDKALWVRNLNANQALSVHLASNTNDVVILEGTAEFIADPQDPLAVALRPAARAKYPHFYSADSPFLPFWALRPSTVYAWTLEGFPRGAARWTIDAPPR